MESVDVANVILDFIVHSKTLCGNLGHHSIYLSNSAYKINNYYTMSLYKNINVIHSVFTSDFFFFVDYFLHIHETRKI